MENKSKTDLEKYIINIFDLDKEDVPGALI